ncbi:acyl carrier protein [Cellulosilyticum lentocellum]|uniref:Phosphopantetheine-binding protein n=1 Tax=Cellulosilyticum lentocellum (strain ATCC 49066 / DSM 5427 / NCIMB 11756 / RHM5) TaxID=642492 RepID=F2JJG4_CELLD|nr:acyl carrier protein [Cellulosilyticum lentocellum]ADZ85559.1 phosphopantetheine-binding protein [Cellulosilyticum lentocellum DSM 5427]
MEVRDRLREIVASVTETQQRNILDESLLKYDLIITSISFIKLITLIEDEFEIQVEDDDLDIEDDMSFNSLCLKIEEIIRRNQ